MIWNASLLNLTPVAWGTVLECVYETHLQRKYKDVDGVSYFRGDTIQTRIREARRSKDVQIIEETKRFLQEDLYFSTEYTEAIVAPSNATTKARAIHLPDAIFIDSRNETPIIRCGEMKASGQNDSSSVPENIDKMVFKTRNSAVAPWEGQENITLRRAILITAAVTNPKGQYPHKAAWVREINKENSAADRREIEVFCNQEAYSFLSGEEISAQDYDDLFLTTTARIELERIKKATTNQ